MTKALLQPASWRACGWLLLGLMLVPALGAYGWRMLQVSEARAFEATLENLSASLNAVVVEGIARGGLDTGETLRRNPFELLRWLPDDYCGELAQLSDARRGCWYYLAQQRQVLYRSRFFDRWQGNGDEMHLFELKSIPDKMRNASQSVGSATSLELVPVAVSGAPASPAREVSR